MIHWWIYCPYRPRIVRRKSPSVNIVENEKQVGEFKIQRENSTGIPLLVGLIFQMKRSITRTYHSEEYFSLMKRNAIQTCSLLVMIFAFGYGVASPAILCSVMTMCLWFVPGVDIGQQLARGAAEDADKYPRYRDNVPVS
eukprot:UN24567